MTTPNTKPQDAVAETDAHKKDSPQKGKAAIKRTELLDEAARVINRKGVTQTSLRIVAKNVGVSRASLYYYVDDQQDLVYQCYIRTCEQLTSLLGAATQNNTHA